MGAVIGLIELPVRSDDYTPVYKPTGIKSTVLWKTLISTQKGDRDVTKLECRAAWVSGLVCRQPRRLHRRYPLIASNLTEATDPRELTA